jgi:hypothetical protein
VYRFIVGLFAVRLNFRRWGRAAFRFYQSAARNSSIVCILASVAWGCPRGAAPLDAEAVLHPSIGFKDDESYPALPDF